MKFAIIGGNTRWSKILIKNFKKFDHKLLFTSSGYINKKNNFKDFKKIPIKSLDFIVLALPVVIAASCAFMMPIATPPNAIIFSTNAIKISFMVSNGIRMNLVAILISSLWIYFFSFILIS